MSFHVNQDPAEFQRRMDKFINGLMELFMRSKRMTFAARDAGDIILQLMVWDKEMEVFGKYCGERGETTVSEYWGAKALAYGMAGKVNEGRSFFDKSRQRRTGGRFAEWNQTYYKS
jgi:hypothetical protein